MLIRSHRQEALSRAYIHAIAGRCGMSCSVREFDYGFDMSLHEIMHRETRCVESGYRLDIQAKSTTLGAKTIDHILYDLEVMHYDDLRDPFAGCPRIMVVLLLPEEEASWMEQTETELLLRGCAYWISLRGMPPTTNTSTIRLRIPKTNLFTVDSLRQLMQTFRKEGHL